MTTVEFELFGKKIQLESGRVARQASGSVVVRCGDCVILSTVCLGPDKRGDFLPLTVEYVEKDYAAGRIPGGHFRREGKLSERETLVSRIIDRPARPLFPEGFTHEIQVINTVMSADGEHETDVLAALGASTAIAISEIPADGPFATVRVARVDGKLTLNPTISEIARADINFVVAGTRDAIVMVEGGAAEATETEVLDALFFAHREMQPLIDLQLELQRAVGKAKVEFTPKSYVAIDESRVEQFLTPRLREAIKPVEKHARRDAIRGVKELSFAEFGNAEAEGATERVAELSHLFEETLYRVVRTSMIESGRRLDGRDTRTVRPISIDLGLLPRAHGSSLFTRGETQAIVSVTVGTEGDAQRLYGLTGASEKTFMLHYNFPPFSVGETKPLRGPGRREVGHGALAERAVQAILPSAKNFPYVLRIVSEITESNGSSSMATVCGSSLSLMQAGIPIKAPVAGVAMGLIKESDSVMILTDILGDEDHLGDMDFKVCGTIKGITALQMDIKIKGLDRDIMKTALEQAREGRLHILSKMQEAISEPAKEMSSFAPRIVTIKINPDKIRDIIGPGGKMIRSISESCDVKLDVSDDGTVNVAGNDGKKIQDAIAIIQSITAEAEVGKLYEGIVKRITEFGAFVEILPGTDGLVHISQLAEGRVNRVTDVVKEGDLIWVKVLEVDRQGKIRLSLKEALVERRAQGL
jgi:polyribonucleotide nucleotidyltransferase